MAGYVAGLGALSWASEFTARKRLAELETDWMAHGGKVASLREAASDKIRLGAKLTRAELAAHLDVSTRKIQRMEAAGGLARCPNMGSVVRYPSRDDL